LHLPKLQNRLNDFYHQYQTFLHEFEGILGFRCLGFKSLT
jgi:hypothetical protein